MISSEVSMIANINKSATVRQTHDGKDFISLGVEFPIHDHQGNSKNIDVSVSVDGGKEMVEKYTSGHRVEINGILYFKKIDDSLYLNLRAHNNLRICDNTTPEKFEGHLRFIGKLGQKGVETRKDKNGKDYNSFSAWTGERDKSNPEKYNFIWVRFRNFQKIDLSCATPKECVEIFGDLQLSLYKEKLQIDSIITKISPYISQPNNNK